MSTLEGVVVGVIAGLVVGLINSIGILALKIPPIVCTLAVGLLAESATLVWSGVVTGTVPGTLMSITSARVGGIAAITWVCVPVSCLVALLLHRTKFGRSVQAIGQNIQAARLAGINVTGTITATYLLSGGLAAISGILLAAYGGLTVDLGTPYLLMSVAAVVLGGSLISGGRSNVTGIWAGALFLSFAVTLLEVLNTGVAGQDIGEGALILALLVVMRVARPRSVRTEERG